jgi:uncharacterized membrane protein
MMNMKMPTARETALISSLSATAIVVAFGRGFSIPFLPGFVEFMTVIIFVAGFIFGCLVGALIGGISVTIYMLVPAPFAHPAAWLFTISPVLLAVMAGLGALFGIAGGILGKRRTPDKVNWKFVAKMGFFGFILTFAYDILSSVGFYLAYPVYASIWQAIYLTFIPLYLVYPPIIHTITNTVIFAIVAPYLILRIKRLQIRSKR